MGVIPDDQAIATIHASIETGATFIDTAEGYRTSEGVLRAWRDENCAKDFECPVADCDVPQFDYHPRCERGRCEVKKTPWVPPNER